LPPFQRQKRQQKAGKLAKQSKKTIDRMKKYNKYIVNQAELNQKGVCCQTVPLSPVV
jgi:hypothetical protein